MALSVAKIAEAAFDGVSGAISDAIHSATLSQVTRGAFNNSTDSYSEVTATETCRVAVRAPTLAHDKFPDYTIGPTDIILTIEGLSTLTPAEVDTITFGGTDYTIGPVADVASAGSLFLAIARAME